MNRKKVSVLGSGRVGSTLAYTLTLSGACSEIVLVDIAKQLAEGEAMDIYQGTPFAKATEIYAGEYEDVAGSDIIVVTLGMARKPGQSRIELAQANVNIIKSVMPKVAQIAPDATYVIVSNPVDILTYATLKVTNLKKEQVLGSGTLLDSGRLRSIIAEYVNLNPINIHGYVLGEHGDSSVVPWSMVSIGGMSVEQYAQAVKMKDKEYARAKLIDMEQLMRESGAKVIQNKGATNYAIAMAVSHLCQNILRDTNAVLAVSSLMTGEYGIEDVCLSIPSVVSQSGIVRTLQPPLTDMELEQLHKSAKLLKDTIASLDI